VTCKLSLLVTSKEVHVMVILLGLAAAVLYGSGDFLGGMATRKAHVLAVLTIVETAAVIAALTAWPAWPGGSAPA
jgi:hypothetical protein